MKRRRQKEVWFYTDESEYSAMIIVTWIKRDTYVAEQAFEDGFTIKYQRKAYRDSAHQRKIWALGGRRVFLGYL